MILSASLSVTYRSGSGDPWASPASNTLVIDVINGCLGGCGVETSDYAATASASAVAELLKFTNGTQNSAFNSRLGAISRSGRTPAQTPLQRQSHG